MFRYAKNIDTAFRQVRMFSIIVIVSMTSLTFFAVYECRRIISESQSRIFILANGRALEAFAADRRDNIPVEARDHIMMFHRWFFTLDPDEKVIRSNISRALYLADGSAKKQYDNLQESGYYINLISSNISQTLAIDSIIFNSSSYPYFFRCLARERITRATTVLTRSLVTEGYLRNVERSDNNPHGFLIERWEIIENKDIKTENR